MAPNSIDRAIKFMDPLSYPPFARSFAAGADVAIALGLIGAFPTAATAPSGWLYTRGHRRRIGLVHALADAFSALPQGTSPLLPAVAAAYSRRLSFLGCGAATLGTHFGVEPAYKHGQGTAPTAFEHAGGAIGRTSAKSHRCPGARWGESRSAGSQCFSLRTRAAE